MGVGVFCGVELKAAVGEGESCGGGHYRVDCGFW